ncbi:hypothetical protein Hanom_Chr05g00427911 [Helianthus anomalus]
MRSTVAAPLVRYISLYAEFFKEGNFWLPMTKFTNEILTHYGIHISQVRIMGMPRITHSEFICRAQNLVPTFEIFNIFYYVSTNAGFYSLNARGGVMPPCGRDPPKSLHD